MVEDDRAKNLVCKREMRNSFTVGEPEGMKPFGRF
jgi:hypothetical protein